jgi:hypothetical protein
MGAARQGSSDDPRPRCLPERRSTTVALLALEQLDPCDAIDWAQSVAAHFQDAHGLPVVAGCARSGAVVWLPHAQDLGAASPTREESANILASDSDPVAPGQ